MEGWQTAFLVIGVSDRGWRPRPARYREGHTGCRPKKSPHKCGQKYWKQCEQCRTEYLSCLLNYSVMRKIIFLI
ncbi:hypothetical protein FML30_17390 [Klebsiella oxytoca]|nr:hypothetical protein [Klebsiella oxytoca]